MVGRGSNHHRSIFDGFEIGNGLSQRIRAGLISLHNGQKRLSVIVVVVMTINHFWHRDGFGSIAFWNMVGRMVGGGKHHHENGLIGFLYKILGELEGIVVSLLAHATMLNQEISMDLARAVMANAVKVSKRQVTFDLIAETVCNYYNINSDLLYSKSRKREISDARQVVMYLAKKYTPMSSTNIGVRLSRNHATVLYACSSIEQRMALEKQLREDLAIIEGELKK